MWCTLLLFLKRKVSSNKKIEQKKLTATRYSGNLKLYLCFNHIKTYRKWSAQIGFCTILQHFLVIFWQTTLVSFTKLRFLWTFWGAKRVLILIGSKLQDKTKLFFVSVFFNFVRKKKRKFLTHKWSFYDHFWPFFCQLIKYLLQN